MFMVGESVEVDGLLFYLLKVEAPGDHAILRLSGNGAWSTSHKLHGTESTTVERDPRTRGWVVRGAVLKEVTNEL